MQFKDVIGQSEVKQQLVEMVQHNRLSHALLFLGREGAGALPLAIAFAQYIVCEKVAKREAGPSLFGEPAEAAPVPGDACGVCPSCNKAAQLIKKYIHFS